MPQQPVRRFRPRQRRCSQAVSDQRAEYEELFRGAGLPLFIEDRSARTDVWTRALPILATVFWLELFGAINLEWSRWANLAAFAAGIAIACGAWALSNRLRGRSPFARPNDIGAWELAGFVLVPALLPAVLNGQTTSAWVTAVGNLLLLGLVYAVIALGLLSILRWTGRHLALQLAGSFSLFARALPLLLLFNLVLVLTTEVWQVFADMGAAQLAATLSLLIVAGVAFLIVQIPREVRTMAAEAGDGTPLDLRERANVGLVMFVAQSVQALVVTVAVWVFFVVFGFIALDQGVVNSWLGHDTQSLMSVTFAGEQLVLSEQLLRVATAIAAFSGLYYVIAVLTESTYRSQFLSDVTSDMREIFAARAQYRRIVASAS